MPLIVVAGPPCSGKSTLARALAARRGISHLEMDGTRRRILPDSPHTRADRAVAYRAMHFASELLLKNGRSAILDAPYGHREDRDDAAAVVERTGGPLLLIECAVTVPTALVRLAARGPDQVRLDLTPAKAERLVGEFRASGLGLLLDSEALTLEECLARAERYVDTGPPVDARAWAASLA